VLQRFTWNHPLAVTRNDDATTRNWQPWSIKVRRKSIQLAAEILHEWQPLPIVGLPKAIFPNPTAQRFIVFNLAQGPGLCFDRIYEIVYRRKSSVHSEINSLWFYVKSREFPSANYAACLDDT
jgi:hypothetical protein